MANLKQVNYPIAFNFDLPVQDQSCDVLGYKGSSQGTMVMKGWHNNYAEFEDESLGIKGCVTCVGTEFIIEVNNRRFGISLKSLVNKCAEITLAEEKETK